MSIYEEYGAFKLEIICITEIQGESSVRFALEEFHSQ